MVYTHLYICLNGYTHIICIYIYIYIINLAKKHGNITEDEVDNLLAGRRFILLNRYNNNNTQVKNHTENFHGIV